ncbi:M28 family metallopeptidase [Spirosoma daeguense]
MRIVNFRIVVIVSFAFIHFLAQAQVDVSHVSISESLLRSHVYLLASDSLQGRGTGTPGQLRASIYCAQSFRLSHLSVAFRVDSVSGSYRQPFAFTESNVVVFGQKHLPISTNSFSYKKRELAPLPRTAEDSSKVRIGHNVGGVLIGTDLKKEIVVISAHYDHLGKSGNQIFYGADDNASGTATVLSLAATFDSLAQQGIRPRRSILFLLFSGEEGGLLGSDYFVHNSPIPLNQIIGDINIDMVGRIDEWHRKKPNYIYLITGAQKHALRRAVETANEQTVNLKLCYDHDHLNDPKQYFYRSDHFNFAKFGLPVLFLMDGEHPDYHQPTDTANRIDYNVLQKRATLVFQTVWLVANQAIN